MPCVDWVTIGFSVVSFFGVVALVVSTVDSVVVITAFVVVVVTVFTVGIMYNSLLNCRSREVFIKMSTVVLLTVPFGV